MVSGVRRIKPREGDILDAVRHVLMLTGKCRLFRNNAGVATYGTAKVRYGLGLGAPDLVGWLVPSGRFFGLETKTPAGRLSDDQKAWHKVARDGGAFVGVVRSPEEAMAALERAVKGGCE